MRQITTSGCARARRLRERTRMRCDDLPTLRALDEHVGEANLRRHRHAVEHRSYRGAPAHHGTVAEQPDGDIVYDVVVEADRVEELAEHGAAVEGRPVRLRDDPFGREHAD